MLGYHHVDLVCCHEFPNIEDEYVIEVCHSSYKVWPVREDRHGWEWKFTVLLASKCYKAGSRVLKVL